MGGGAGLSLCMPVTSEWGVCTLVAIAVGGGSLSVYGHLCMLVVVVGRVVLHGGCLALWMGMVWGWGVGGGGGGGGLWVVMMTNNEFDSLFVIWLPCQLMAMWHLKLLSAIKLGVRLTK
jgi:hypothetical protein